ncbi:hypothetical protein SLEP1_g35358 [Rubroshorea leprosula]|uniref:Uncharacterized protein n=1 Tax=Rubroshorea leprosula TaxID=152421 RepID=A0AAV5KNF4_9ROSI|nr:hypothetical protein SLEP1_g35358 [Rubroshorea leprosula]
MLNPFPILLFFFPLQPEKKKKRGNPASLEETGRKLGFWPSFLALEPDWNPEILPPAGSFRICSALPSAVRRLLLFVGVICSDFG